MACNISVFLRFQDIVSKVGTALTATRGGAGLFQMTAPHRALTYAGTTGLLATQLPMLWLLYIFEVSEYDSVGTTDPRSADGKLLPCLSRHDICRACWGPRRLLNMILSFHTLAETKILLPMRNYRTVTAWGSLSAHGGYSCHHHCAPLTQNL
jgi:hypothetical protein